MRVVGIIAEYNPFHKGHQFQLEEAKRVTNADFCIVIMSGHYVQRGEPAILDKWTRAEMALNNGADLVIELPVHFSTASAEFFSFASVCLLEQLGLVDALCFGSEAGSIPLLEAVARVLVEEPEDYKVLLKSFMKQGYSYVTSRAMALLNYLDGIDDNESIENTNALRRLIKSPNNILGIEYIKAIIKLNSKIQPYTIKRMGAHYHDDSINKSLPSATAIRKAIFNQQSLKDIEASVPKTAYDLLLNTLQQRKAPVYLDDYSPILQYKLLMLPSSSLEHYVDINEGIQNRFKQLAKKYYNISEIVRFANTKRYPHSKIRRALLHILLDIKKDSFNHYIKHGYAQYIRVLGFKKTSSALLKALKETARLPIISNVKDAFIQLENLQKNMLLDEIKATECYNLILRQKYDLNMKNDYNQPMIIV